MPSPATIDTSAVLDMALGAIVAGVGFTVTFALALRAFARAPALREQGRPMMGLAATTFATLALLAALAAVGVGLAILGQGSPLG
jgi:F0F1-type ATP synthase membrane subunit c/vacuolar-type H+-ATPase subunit K